MLNKKTCLLILLLISMLFAGPSLANEYIRYIPSQVPPAHIDGCIEDDNAFLGWNYFVNTLPDAEPDFSQIRLIKYPEDEHMLVWGQEHGDCINGVYRYLGINALEEYITNIDWPYDVPISTGAMLDDNNWIANPWTSSLVNLKLKQKGEPLIHKSPWDGDPKFLPNIVKGLQEKHTSEFRGDPELTWTDYVHILQPPTYYGWGVGRAWHIKNGEILYRTIPLAPSKFHLWMPNFYVKDFDPGCSKEMVGDGNAAAEIYAAEPGETYTATITFGIDTLLSTFPVDQTRVFVAGEHRLNSGEWDTVLKYQSGSGSISGPLSLWPYVPSGPKGQAVIFTEPDTEVTATFNWIAMADTKELVAAINYPPAQWLYYEGTDGNRFEDNVAVVPIAVKRLPDNFVQELNPGTVETEEGQEYTGTVSFGLYDTFDKPVKARLGLTHNGWPITEVNDTEITFNPGEIKSFSFTIHGQAGDSKLEAEIWPLEPTEKDINWSNNQKITTINSRKTDIAVGEIRQQCPVITGSNQMATVSISNFGTGAETFQVSYYAGGAKLRTEIISLEEGGSADRSFNWTAPQQAGSIELKVVADPEKLLKDVNLNNNTGVKTVYIKERGLPPTACDSQSNKTSGTWTENYRVITGHTDDNKHKWATRKVTYQENLAIDIKLNTKQGVQTDPANPQPEDRESRGSWEIIPWAQENGLDPNKVTRAGYGFELEVETIYWTDYETKVPDGIHNTAIPKGGILFGPRSVRAEFWDTTNNSVEIVELEPIFGISGGQKVTWALPETNHTFSDGTQAWERKHYVETDTIDGRYSVVVNIDSVGKTGLRICREDYVTIHGDMYDDMYSTPDKRDQ
ncbi:Athe_2463 domain-containing protein [Phosphitispora sp. TUW77]|uniref:Athe_2463 domain-containing protein n=1 Tax=Phosphitispora sp. TUW77 TaxID=3152361 RepID=UPI003AB80FB3